MLHLQNPALGITIFTMLLALGGMAVAIYPERFLSPAITALLFFGGLCALACSMVTIALIRLVYWQVTDLMVSYVDYRQQDEIEDATRSELEHKEKSRPGLVFSYTIAGTKQRVGLLVKGIEPKPHSPLVKIKREMQKPLRRTQSSLSIHFCNHLTLDLGFLSLGEMLGVLKLLDPEAKMYDCVTCERTFWKQEEILNHQIVSGHAFVNRTCSSQ